jgi:hypothetical protein
MVEHGRIGGEKTVSCVLVVLGFRDITVANAVAGWAGRWNCQRDVCTRAGRLSAVSRVRNVKSIPQPHAILTLIGIINHPSLGFNTDSVAVKVRRLQAGP